MSSRRRANRGRGPAIAANGSGWRRRPRRRVGNRVRRRFLLGPGSTPLSLRWRRGRLSPSPPPCPRPAGLALFPFRSNGGDGGAGATAVLPSPGQPAQPRQCGPQAGRGNGSASPRPCAPSWPVRPPRPCRRERGGQGGGGAGRAPRVSSGTSCCRGGLGLLPVGEPLQGEQGGCGGSRRRGAGAAPTVGGGSGRWRVRARGVSLPPFPALAALCLAPLGPRLPRPLCAPRGPSGAPPGVVSPSCPR